MQINISELNDAYINYGFEILPSKFPNICVFAIQTGHFYNADLVNLGSSEVDVESCFNELKSAGYACRIRSYSSIEDAKKQLFMGFFTADATKKRLLKEYSKYTDSVVKLYSDNANYSFLKTECVVDGAEVSGNICDIIYERISEPKPILFLIEAAAGFGKTCTAYELINTIINKSNDKVPLFAELARNRQAKIFRYILLDEIDRSFPYLNSKLVQSEIKNGNIPVVLDGFDELLRQSKGSENFEKSEPMLETIGELLKDAAKIILTTRRTAIFDGDSFYTWMAQHEHEFDVVRIYLKEPTIENWLPSCRLNVLNRKDFDTKSLSNPVLLAYLRCIDQSVFDDLSDKPSKIIDKYFEFMLKREMNRQELEMTITEQEDVLKYLAHEMVEYNFTAETKDFFETLIIEKFGNLLESTQKKYHSSKRPTIEELANKLTSHAFLDRKGESDRNIGFVNEFVFGNYVASNILDDAKFEWIGDERFIDSAVTSYLSRSNIRKNTLWCALNQCLSLINQDQKIRYTYYLTNKLDIDIANTTIEQLTFENIDIGKKELTNVTFVSCVFNNVLFHIENAINLMFVECVFNSCDVIDECSVDGCVRLYGCRSSSSQFEEKIIKQADLSLDFENNDADIQKYILEKYWPVGRLSFHKHRPISGLCASNNQYSNEELYSGIENLKRKGILVNANKASFLELNIEMVAQVREILGR